MASRPQVIRNALDSPIREVSVRRLLRYLFTPLAHVVLQLVAIGIRFTIWRMAPPRVAGIRVVAVEDEQDRAFAQVRAAQSLIGRTDPDRLRQMRTDLYAILVIRLPGYRGRLWRRPLVGCQIDHDFARDAPIRAIALVLVHEAQHARIRHQADYSSALARVDAERQCLDAELTFAKRLPNAGKDTQAVRGRLATVEERYSDAALDRSEAQFYRGIGMSEWLVRFILGLRAPTG